MYLKIIKSILKVGTAALLLGLLIYGFMPQPVKVDIALVQKGDLLITMEGEGKTRIHDKYVVSAPIDGRITRIESEPGMMITAGKTIIANMYPANPVFLDKRSHTQASADVDGAKAALALAGARVRQSQARVDYDRSDFARTKQLYTLNSVSKASLENAELRLKTLQAELDTAQSNQQVMLARLAAAQARLLQPEENDTGISQDCQLCIHSPIDGQVLRILHKSEGIVPVGTPLVEIGDPGDLEVVIEMLSTNAVQVTVGDEALIKRWGGSEDIKARVKTIEPSGFTKISALGIEEQRVNVILSFVSLREKWQTLGDGYRVEAAIITDRAQNVITVSLSALFRQNQIWSVFRVIEGRASLTQVSIGRRNERFAQVIDGLSVTDKIITHPGNDVADGVRVDKR